MRGKLQQLIVTSSGELRLGYSSTKLGSFAKEICARRVDRDAPFIWHRPPAEVYALGKDGRTHKAFEADFDCRDGGRSRFTPQSLRRNDPEGKVYKISMAGNGAAAKTDEPFSKLRARTYGR